MGTPTQGEPFLLQNNELIALKEAEKLVQEARREIKPFIDHLEHQEKAREILLRKAREAILAGKISTGSKLADSYILHIGYDRRTIHELAWLNDRLKDHQGEFLCLILERKQKESRRVEGVFKDVLEQRLDFIVGIINGEICLKQGDLMPGPEIRFSRGKIELPTSYFNSSLFFDGFRVGRLCEFNSNDRYPEEGEELCLTGPILHSLDQEEHPEETSLKIIELMIAGGPHEILSSVGKTFEILRGTNKSDVIIVTDEKQFLRDLNIALASVYHPDPDLSKPPVNPHG